MKSFAKVLIVAALILSATALVAQSTSYEVKSGTVVSVFNDQLVAKMPNGEVKQFTIPAGMKFTVDGKQVGLADLTPGTQLTAVIKTTSTPHTVQTVQIKNGEVLKVVGRTLIVRENGVSKQYQIPSGFRFLVDGKLVPLNEIRPGYKLNAEIVYTSEKTVTTKEANFTGSTPTPEPARAAALAPEPTPVAAPAEPAPAPAPQKLPKTASVLPLIGLLGILLTASGFIAGRAARS